MRLALLIIAIGAVVQRLIVRGHLRSIAAQSLGADRILGAIHERVFPMARVIDGDMPIDRISAHGVTGAAEGRQVGQNEFGHVEMIEARFRAVPDFVASDAIVRYLNVIGFLSRSCAAGIQLLNVCAHAVTSRRVAVVVQKR